MADPSQEVDSLSAFGEGEAAKAERWKSEITLSERSQETWLTRCREIIRRYTEQKAVEDSTAGQGVNKRRFATLWSNIEVLKPAVYAKPPTAVVLRRFKDADPLGRVASEVLERALNYSIDIYDFDWVMKECRDENLLTGLGVLWTRYVPTFDTKPTGQISDSAEAVTETDEGEGEDKAEQEQDEYLATEQVVCDHVNYADFGTNRARTWDEVRFVWRRVYMTRAALQERFKTEVPGTKKTIGDVVPLDWKPQELQATQNDYNADQFAKAQIYEIWDLDTRKAMWLSKAYPSRLLDERDDPLGLDGFFPCPRPVMATLGPDSTIPIPDYMFYKDQAQEIDELTVRIGILTDSLRMVGFYSGKETVNLQNVFKAGNENKLIPIDGFSEFKEGGGVRGIIEWVPIDMVVACLTACFEARKQLLDDVYQITGISDIMRGDTDPRETKGAQVLKSQWGSSRVRERQKEIARFARDALRIKAQIIGDKFSWQTLAAMTNVDLFENQQAKSVAVMEFTAQSQAQMAQQPPSPDGQQPAMPEMPQALQDKLSKPSWEEVMQFLRSDALRRFRIDVETDSTVEPDQATAKSEMTEYLTSMSGLITAASTVIPAMPKMAEVFGVWIKQANRTFSAGREAEEVIDRVMDQLSGMPPAPVDGEGKAGPDPQVEALKAQLEQMKIEQKEASDKRADETKRLELMIKSALENRKLDVEENKTEADLALGHLDAMTDRINNAEQTQQAAIEAERDRQHMSGEAQADREHNADQGDRDRQNSIDAIKAKPKPKVGA